ncbi:GNAT family N-acetyltransferase [Chloroflexota bacterium]
MSEMGLIVRPLALADIAPLVDLDHSYHTDYVWQMDLQTLASEVNVRFRETRLPRSMRVEYPHNPSLLAEDWKGRFGLLVAEREEAPVGYLGLARPQSPQLIQVTDLVVMRRLRRQGIGSALVLAAQSWAAEREASLLMLEMQSKNHPMVCLANKLGYEFCGYNDRYYSNQDIALFFAKKI